MLWEVTKWASIILIILWIILSIYLYVSSRNKIGEDKMGFGLLIGSITIIPIGLFMVTLIIYFIVGMSIFVNSNTIEAYKYTTPIYCLNDSAKIEGRSYLYSGYVNQKMVYRTIYTDNYGGKKMWEIDANKSSVFEDGKNEILVYGLEFENPKVSYWLKGTNFNNLRTENRYEVHIPKDSITTEYKVDLQ